jgi:hypothetical protein
MKILFIHPEEDPEKGPWTNLPWDRIVDLGLGGIKSHSRWTQRFKCPITSLKSLQDGFHNFQRVRRLLGLGCGRLIDERGLDWWEIMSLLLHAELETLILLQRFVETVGAADEIYVSRPGLHASLLRCLVPERVQVFPLRRWNQKGSLGHYARVFKKFSTPELVGIFWDKYDLGYQFRGRFARRRPPSQRPVVLLPTAYVNVSKTGVAYANTFPKEDFLLITTRRSGWVEHPPKNVAAARLASYASI